MKQLVDYIKYRNDQRMNESAEIVASIIAASDAFAGYNGGSSDDHGIIRCIIDDIKDKRKQKIVSNVFHKLENDKDIENLIQDLDKKYVERLIEINKKYNRSESQIQAILNNRNIYDIIGYTAKDEKCKELVELIKTKLDKKELKYIDEILKEIKYSKNKKFKQQNEEN